MKQKKQLGKIKKVAGPLVVATGLPQAKMYEVVKVGQEQLIGEIIRIQGNEVSIQVYEETSGIGPDEPVVPSGASLTVELGPGLLSNIYDGIQRPLEKLKKDTGAFLERGASARALPENKKWPFKPLKKSGDKVKPGDVLGEVKETKIIIHKILIPPFVKPGKLDFVAKPGNYTIDEVVAKIGHCEITMCHKWPIRNPRPIKSKLVPKKALITGQRVIDTFAPVAKGGAGAIPGPFGSGKTVTQHQFAKWADADVVVFVGCGERGNEMTDLLMEFPELKDPKTGYPLMHRTVLIANTSNMPVAAREASVYTGITIAEYFRDMGYDVALMADSTSRWAEALREISSRLEEMPGDEGYPAYLGSRTAAFYERAGAVKCLGSDKKQGSLTVIGAVSPPGGDLSEPVTQNTLRVTKVFWALDSKLAYRRHFPAINWLNSYSLYKQDLAEFFSQKGGLNFTKMTDQAMEILQKEDELQEIVRLVGVEALSKQDQFLLGIARIIREDFLHQNAFDEIDTYTSLRKQYLMLQSIILLYKQGLDLIKQDEKVKISDILTKDLRSRISKMRFIKEDNLDEFAKIEQLIKQNYA